MGRPLPPIRNWVATYTSRRKILPPPPLQHYENNDRNDEEYQKKAGVKTCAENISRQLATGQCEHHQNDTECN
jgi:hypothetical protein